MKVERPRMALMTQFLPDRTSVVLLQTCLCRDHHKDRNSVSSPAVIIFLILIAIGLAVYEVQVLYMIYCPSFYTHFQFQHGALSIKADSAKRALTNRSTKKKMASTILSVYSDDLKTQYNLLQLIPININPRSVF